MDSEVWETAEGHRRAGRKAVTCWHARRQQEVQTCRQVGTLGVSTRGVKTWTVTDDVTGRSARAEGGELRGARQGLWAGLHLGILVVRDKDTPFLKVWEGPLT